MDTITVKDEIRKVMRAQRATLEPAWVKAISDQLAARLMVLPEFVHAEVICAYLSLPGEVQTQAILKAAWLAGKKVAVPARRDDGEYMPVWITPDDPVLTARFGVRQPAVPFWAKPDRFDLIIVPGVAFSHDGARLGHGKGYYDRMLARLAPRLGCRLGICFSCQLVPEIPVTEHDVGMQLIVTENTVIRAGGKHD